MLTSTICEEAEQRVDAERSADRRRRLSITVLVILAILTSLVSFACEDVKFDERPPGEGRGVSSYAARVCKGLGDWASMIEAAGGTSPPTPLNIAEAQQQITDVLSAAIDATDRLVAKLERIEPPDLKNADALHVSILDAVTQLRVVLNELREEVEAMQTASVEEAQEAVERMAVRISQEAREIQATLRSQTGPGELATAFNNVESCEALRS